MPRLPEKDSEPRFRTPWFWWAVVILLAACFAAVSWAGLLYVYRFPEKAENYEFLEKLNQLPKPEEISRSDAPEGIETLSAISLHSKFLALPDASREQLNLELRRRFIAGLVEQDLIYYVKGSYKVLEVRDLTEDDFVSGGFAVKLQASIQVDEYRPPSPYPLYLELILPNAKAAQKIFYPVGEILELNRVPNYVALLHGMTQTLANERIAVVTAMPIVKTSQRTAEGSAIRVSLPMKYQLSGSLPLFSYEADTGR